MTSLTGFQLAFLVFLFIFFTAAIIMHGIRSEKEASRKRWQEKFKDTPMQRSC